MENLSIGLLEFGHRSVDSLTAIENIMEYAIKADELHFSRFWLAEHHDDDLALPYSNPEIVLTLLAGMTERIRLGAAGILVKIHEPYFTTVNFKLLNNLFNNRVDLGLAKSNPENPYIKDRLYDIHDKDLFEKRIKEIHNLLYNEKENKEKGEIVIPPYGGNLPELWYLSSSYHKFTDAIIYGMNYCRSLIHGQNILDKNYAKEELNEYRSIFYNKNHRYPKVALAISFYISKSFDNSKTLSRFKPPFSNITSIMFSSIDQLYDRLHQYQFLYGIDEFVLLDLEEDNRKRIENIENISEKFNLKKEVIHES